MSENWAQQARKCGVGERRLAGAGEVQRRMGLGSGLLSRWGT